MVRLRRPKIETDRINSLRLIDLRLALESPRVAGKAMLEFYEKVKKAFNKANEKNGMNRMDDKEIHKVLSWLLQGKDDLYVENLEGAIKGVIEGERAFRFELQNPQSERAAR